MTGVNKVALLVVVAALLAGGGMRLHRHHQEKRLLEDILAARTHQMAEEKELGDQFEKLDLDRYTRPESLLSPDDISAGRGELQKFRGLLSQFDELVKKEQAEFDAVVDKTPPGAVRDEAILEEGKAMDRNRAVNGKVRQALNDRADAIQAMLNFADANLGHLQVSGGAFVPESQAQADQLQALNKRFAETGKAAQAAGAEARQLADESDRATAKAKDLLKH